MSEVPDGTPHYSDDGFWAKVRAVARTTGRTVVETALKLYYVLVSPATPPAAKAIIVAALGYFILPIDVVPDVIAGLGLADDGTILAAALRKVAQYVTPDIERQANDKARELVG